MANFISELPGWRWTHHNGDFMENWKLRDPLNRNRCTLWANGTWHTWDEDGVGGENSREESITEAMAAAVQAVIRQGWAYPLKDAANTADAEVHPLTTLNKDTVLYVVACDGISKMTFERLIDAVNGGMKLDAVTITTDNREATAALVKYQNIQRLTDILNRLSPEEVAQVADAIENGQLLVAAHLVEPRAGQSALPVPQ